MSVTANVLDPVHETLSPYVWEFPGTPEPVLLRPHHKFIVEFVTKILNGAGYSDTAQWLRLFLTGSLTTYQYGDASDCDVSLFVYTQTGLLAPPVRSELIALMVTSCDGVTLPGTPYEMQCFVVAPGILPEALYKPGLRSGYDITNDVWMVPPNRSLAHDVEKEMHNNYIHALQIADKMHMLLEYEPQQALWLWNRLHKKRRRAEKLGLGDFSIENVVFKMLESRGLARQVAALSG